ncbi:MAG: DUF2834 domain-containing protein [Acidobacteriota bacterium]|nr:DUF2834 domain-containing protein [Acidobacteriota bacterium]
MKKFYLFAMFIGAALPLYFFITFFAEQGFDVMKFLNAAFANKASTALIADLLLSALVAFVFVARDGKQLGINKLWMVILGTCLVGLSFSLPLYLYFRETKTEAHQHSIGGKYAEA